LEPSAIPGRRFGLFKRLPRHLRATNPELEQVPIDWNRSPRRGWTPTTRHSFGKLPKAPEKFRQAFQFVPETINPLPIRSENFAGKLLIIKGLRPNLPSERPNAPKSSP
jgi:hypothetical protein